MPNISAKQKAVVGRPCLTCRRRKIKCDRSKPGCQRCQKAGLECAGYLADSFVLVVPTHRDSKVKFKHTRSDGQGSKSIVKDEDTSNSDEGHDGQEILILSPKPSINVAPENRMQILSYFIERFLPASMTSSRKFETPSTWIRSLPGLLGRWEVLDTALSAVCLAYIGDIHQDHVHLHESQRFYNDVLQKFGSLSLDSIKSANEGMLTTTMTMAMYELFHCSYNGLQGWIFHVRGACRLLELRGPPTEDSPLDLSLYSRIRITALWDAFGYRKGLFLARKEWQNLSDSPHDTLLDLLVYIPGLLERTDSLISTTLSGGKLDVDAVDNLLGHWGVLSKRLIRWYTDFDRGEPNGLFECGPLKQDSHPYLEADRPHLHSVFPQVISFKDAYVAQIVIMYWFGQLVIHTGMMQLYMARQDHQARMMNPNAFPVGYKSVYELSKENVQHAGEYYATKICQSTASLRGGYGFQMVMVPLWASQQFFALCGDDRFDWSQTVLKNFGKVGGFMLAEPLANYEPETIARMDWRTIISDTLTHN